jgi:hypothetical protein
MPEQRGWKVTAIDISDVAVGRAREAAPTTSSGCSVTTSPSSGTRSSRGWTRRPALPTSATSSVPGGVEHEAGDVPPAPSRRASVKGTRAMDDHRNGRFYEADLLAVRRERMSRVADIVEGIDGRELDRQVASPNGGTTTVKSCLHVVFREEWWHDQYANRDLAVLERRPAAG